MPNYHGGLPPSNSNEYELAPLFNKGLISIGNNTTGIVLNLNKMGVQVTAYMGAGMPPVENILTPYGLLGGSYLQRSVIRPRPLVLACHVFALTLFNLQKIKQAIINVIAPSNSLQTSKDLFIRYQNVDINGFAVGTALDCPVIYNGGLEGSTSDLYHEAFTLNFLELAPPSIHEISFNTQNNILANAPTAAAYSLRGSNGNLQPYPGSAGSPAAAAYSQTGEAWYGVFTSTVNGFVRNNSGSVNQAISGGLVAPGTTKAIIFDSANNPVVAGDFTSPQPFLMKLVSGSWVALATTPLNSDVKDIVYDNSGNLYIVGGGNITTNLGRINAGTSVVTNLGGTGFTGGLPKCIAKGPDGNIYVGGTFSAANGVSCNNIAKYDPVGNTFTPLGPGLSGAVNSIAFTNDGKLVAGQSGTATGSGQFVGVVPLWNGNQWQATGGVNAIGNGAAECVIVDTRNNDIYAFGGFTALISGAYVITARCAKFNGSIWVPQDVYLNGLQNTRPHIAAIRATDGELVIPMDTSSPLLAGYNAVNYAGTADVIPQIKITGPGRLYSINNFTTNKHIYFNYALLAGEVATLQPGGPNGISFTSTFYGNVINRILPGSDLSSFALLPGINSITNLYTGTTGASKIELIFQNYHWSFEAGAA